MRKKNLLFLFVHLPSAEGGAGVLIFFVVVVVGLAKNVVHQTVEATAECRENALVGRTAAAGTGLGGRSCQLGTILRLGGLDGPIVGAVVANSSQEESVPLESVNRKTQADLHRRSSPPGAAPRQCSFR